MPKFISNATGKPIHWKEFCVRGHRLPHDGRKYCIECRHEKNPPKGREKKICKRGHDRVENGSEKGGNCVECDRNRKIILYRENIDGYKDDAKKRARIFTCNQNWKKTGVKNDDESQFTMQDYNRVFQIQGGMCKTCGKHQAELKRALCCDHDHKTGRFRGLLCVKCNTALGNVDDNSDILRNMITYLIGVSDGQ